MYSMMKVDNNFASTPDLAIFTTAMYLAHLGMLEKFTEEYTRMGPAADTIVATAERLQNIRGFAVDLQAVCTVSLASARSLATYIAGGGAAPVGHMRGLYGGARTYMGRKLDARVVGADALITGFVDTRDIISQILIQTGDDARRNRSFDIIRKAVYDLDNQAGGQGARSTYTFAAFEDASGGGGGSDEGSDIMHISGSMAGASEAPQQTLSSSSSSSGQAATTGNAQRPPLNPMLGSILLDSSEQRVQENPSSAAGAATTGEEMETSLSPTASEKQQARKAASSSSGKGQFKKVQAKLL
jgi:hypothetical protein